MAIPELPPKLRFPLDQAFPGLYNWWIDLKGFIVTKFATSGDITLITKGKGIILTNNAGTVTKRVRLNDAGNGLIYEDVS